MYRRWCWRRCRGQWYWRSCSCSEYSQQWPYFWQVCCNCFNNIVSISVNSYNVDTYYVKTEYVLYFHFISVAIMKSLLICWKSKLFILTHCVCLDIKRFLAIALVRCGSFGTWQGFYASWESVGFLLHCYMGVSMLQLLTAFGSCCHRVFYQNSLSGFCETSLHYRGVCIDGQMCQGQGHKVKRCGENGLYAKLMDHVCLLLVIISDWCAIRIMSY